MEEKTDWSNIAILIVGVILILGSFYTNAKVTTKVTAIEDKLSKFENFNSFAFDRIKAIEQGLTPIQDSNNQNIIRLWYSQLDSDTQQNIVKDYEDLGLNCPKQYIKFVIEDYVDNATVEFGYRVVLQSNNGLEMIYRDGTIKCYDLQMNSVECKEICNTKEETQDENVEKPAEYV